MTLGLLSINIIGTLIHNTRSLYYIRNKNRGVRQPITREQAQSPEDIARGWDYRTIDDTQARELALQLGLAS